MKRLSIITVTIMIVMSTNLMGQWEQLTGWETGQSRLRTIDFVNENVGWIGGDDALLKTEDGGKTWISIPLDENIGFDLIDFMDESVGWGINVYWDSIEKRCDLIITKSVDGGQIWTIQKKLTDYDVGALYAVNDKVVYVAGEGDVFKTSDGGSNWIDISPNLTDKTLESVWFVNSEVGMITGNSNLGQGLILKTFDGGHIWDEIIVPEFEDITDLQFINDSTGYFLAADSNGRYLCATTDTCSSWTIKLKSDYPIKDYFCLNKTTVFAIVEDSISTYIMKSMDGGDSWEKIEEFFNEMPKIYFNTATKGLLYGRISPLRFGGGYNVLWQCTDGGDSWILTKLNYPFLDVFFIDQYIGFVSGGGYRGGHGEHHGWLFKTYNGGESWDFVSEMGGPINKYCLFITRDTGFTLTGGGVGNRIFKTIDCGTTWDTVFENNIDSLGFNFFCKQIGFINEDIGYTVGGYNISNVEPGGAGILKTSDGGENWDLVWTYHHTDEYNYRLNSVHTVNKTTWAVGNSGIVVKSVSPDSFRVLSVNTDLPLNDVFFSDENHGWIAGGYSNDQDFHSILLKTRDGGQAWQEKRFQEYQINDMYFADSLRGWAVGNDTSYIDQWNPSNSGILLETWDAGDSWHVQVEGLSAPLTALHFKDGYGWAVGGNGLVLRTDDGTNWVESNTGNTFPNTFSLSQNYPNPFNPRTIINYELPITNDVELSIYNLLGQKVVTLVSVKQKAGYHQVEWNASGFASGIYYYKITTGEFQDVKKMILLR